MSVAPSGMLAYTFLAHIAKAEREMQLPQGVVTDMARQLPPLGSAPSDIQQQAFGLETVVYRQTFNKEGSIGIASASAEVSMTLRFARQVHSSSQS